MSQSIKDQATSRPWHLEDEYCILNSDYDKICNTYDNTPFDRDVATANALLIVKAVNSFEKNQETIKELIDALRYSTLGCSCSAIENCKYCNRAEQVISKAESN